MRFQLDVVEGPTELAAEAADVFIQLARQALEQRGHFSVALSGGSTPRALFQQLSDPIKACQLDWQKVHLFWGDERCLPPEHPESNYGMTRQALLENIPIPPGNIVRVCGELGAAGAAAAYQGSLQDFFGIESLPRFDLILLGLGEDGHTASLFPGTPALEEGQRWVVGVEHHSPPPPLVDRVSLTLPVINAARQVLFLVSGAAKAAVLERVLKPPRAGETALPAQRIRPDPGQLTWLVDRASLSDWIPS